MPLGQAVKIPVFSEYGFIEMADAARVRYLQTALNAEFVRRRKDGLLMRIILHHYGTDYGLRSRYANPQKDVYKAESENNPRNVWTFKRECGSAATSSH